MSSLSIGRSFGYHIKTNKRAILTSNCLAGDCICIYRSLNFPRKSGLKLKEKEEGKENPYEQLKFPMDPK